MITGQKLRAFRTENGVRPVDVAAKMGVDRQRIGQIESQVEVGHDVAVRFVKGVVWASTPDEPEPRVDIEIIVVADGEEWARW